MQIEDRVFVVTGGGNGIGREVVLALLERGASVAAVDLRPDALAETTALAGGWARRLSTHTVDITDQAAVGSLPDAVIERHGQVDGLVNVAGIIQPFVPVADLDLAVIEKVMAVNFWGTVHMDRAFLPALRQRPESALVNVSSMGALAPVPGQAAYGASKAAVKLLTEALWAELRGTPVAVTVVFPGGVATHITDNSGVEMPHTAGDRPAIDAATTSSLTSPAEAARQIVTGTEKGSYRVVIGKDARALDKLSRLSPQRATELIASKMKGLLDR